MPNVIRKATAPATSGIQVLRFTPAFSPIGSLAPTSEGDPLSLWGDFYPKYRQFLANRVSAALNRVRSQLAHAPENSPIRLAKKTSNLFRDRAATQANGLDVGSFSSVFEVDFEVDPVSHTAEVGGMTTYEDLVAATLPYGLMPLCVPQLRTTTLVGTARVWRLYMAASRIGFELNTIQLHQMLGVKLGPRGKSGMPLRAVFS